MSTSAVTKPDASAQPARSARNSVIARMAERFQMDPVAFDRTIRGTIFPSDKKDASNEQMAAFLVVCEQYQLNPFIKEIYAYPNKAGGITPIVSVDGWHTIAQRHPEFGGCEQRFIHDEVDGDLGCETTIHRKDWPRPVVHVEWLSECKRNTDPWKMVKRMLGHKSFIQTARIAFGFSGIYDPDEGERIREAEFTVKADAPLAGRSRTDQLAARLGVSAPEPDDQSQGAPENPDAEPATDETP